MYGDGSANQGQLWEAANMAALWKIPTIFCCENNMYGMGTSVERSSANVEYYKQGNIIPGIKIDGMDVLAVKKGMEFARNFCLEGNGPIFVEMKTYRYHGHSMSDPGTTYRDRDEISDIRKTRDPIELLKGRIMDSGFATEKELLDIEKAIRKEVGEALANAKTGSFPPVEELCTHITTTGDHEANGKDMVSEYPPEIRMPDRTKSILN